MSSSIADCPVSVLIFNTDAAGGSNYGANLQELSAKVTAGTYSAQDYPTLDYVTVFPTLELPIPTTAPGCNQAYITGVSLGLILQQENYYIKVCVCGQETIAS